MRSRPRRSKKQRTAKGKGKMEKSLATREATIMHDEGEEIQYEWNVSKLHPIEELERSEGSEGHVLIEDTAPVVVDSLKFADLFPGIQVAEDMISQPQPPNTVHLGSAIQDSEMEMQTCGDVNFEALVTPNDETFGRNKEEIEIYVNPVTVVSGLQESVKTDNISSMLIAENGAEQEEFGVAQPLLIPYPVKKSSWKSCCEMFGLFSGSN